jgi:hypothetical protein
VPNGSVEFVCVLGGLPFVIGVRSGLTRETLQPGTVMVGVRFRTCGRRPVRWPAVAGIDRNCGENHNHAPTYQPLLRARRSRYA